MCCVLQMFCVIIEVSRTHCLTSKPRLGTGISFILVLARGAVHLPGYPRAHGVERSWFGATSGSQRTSSADLSYHLSGKKKCR